MQNNSKNIWKFNNELLPLQLILWWDTFQLVSGALVNC